MSETSKKIIEEIRERHVTHRPKWQFLIKNISIWTALVAAIFFGALSISIEEAIVERGLAVAPHGFGLTGIIVQGASLLWIACTILFIVLAFLNLRHVKEGYRYRAWWIAVGVILVVVTIGFFLRGEGVGNRVEGALEHNAFYHGAFNIDHDGPGR